MNEFAKLDARLDPLYNTAFADMPTSGSASFEGLTAITMATPDGETRLYGDTVITADFREETIDGMVNGFHGTVDGGAAQSYEGSLVLDGLIGEARPNAIAAGIGGTLTGGGQELDFTGELAGSFVGTPIKGLELESEPEAVIGTLNGEQFRTTIEVLAEK